MIAGECILEESYRSLPQESIMDIDLIGPYSCLFFAFVTKSTDRRK